jgi:hypothetical protein
VKYPTVRTDQMMLGNIDHLTAQIAVLEHLGYKVAVEALAPEVDPETGELITRTAS